MTHNPPLINVRLAEANDFAAILAIYNHYIATSTCTFDTKPFTVEQRADWFGQFQKSGPYRLLVAEVAGEVRGYACSMRFRPKLAYETSVEVSVYIEEGSKGQGMARLLYEHLFAQLDGVHRAYGCITMPNDASIALHHNFGFEQCALLTEVGYKFGAFYDVAYFEKKLGPH